MMDLFWSTIVFAVVLCASMFCLGYAIGYLRAQDWRRMTVTQLAAGNESLRAYSDDLEYRHWMMVNQLNRWKGGESK